MANAPQKLPVHQALVGPAVVLWEHIFAPDKKRVVNGKPVGDDRFNMTVLLTQENARTALEAAGTAAADMGVDSNDMIRAAVFERVKPLDDDALKALGFAYKMKCYSRDPVPVVSRQGGREIKPSDELAARDPYPQFRLGVKQGATVHLAIGFRGYEDSKGFPGVSAFLNSVLVDESVEPRQLPGGRPDPTKLFGSLIEGAEVPAAAGAFADLIEQPAAEPDKPAFDAAAALGIKL